MTRRTVAPSLLVRHARVVTVGADRRVLSPGYLAVADDRIIGVGPDADCPHDRAERVIDATGKALLPGFVNAHTHAIHILMRGGLSDDRALYDWLFNVVLPGLRAYGREDVEVAAKLYCLEALRSGVTTFVDNVEFPTERWDMAADTAIGVYRDAGLRVMFARMFYDHTPDDFVPVIEAIQAKEPEVRHDPGDLEPTAEALASIERLMRRHHGSADGRVQVWPSPGVARFCTPRACWARGTWPGDSAPWSRCTSPRPRSTATSAGCRASSTWARSASWDRTCWPATASRPMPTTSVRCEHSTSRWPITRSAICCWPPGSRRSRRCRRPVSPSGLAPTTAIATTASTSSPT